MKQKNCYLNPNTSTRLGASADNLPNDRKTTRLWIAVIGLATMLGSIDLAHAAGTITVNSTAQRGAGTSTVCTLGAAIISANNNSNTDGCTISGTATPPYTINVPSGIYTLAAVDHLRSGIPYGLPDVQNGPLTLQGASMTVTVIQRSTANGTPDFGI